MKSYRYLAAALAATVLALVIATLPGAFALTSKTAPKTTQVPNTTKKVTAIKKKTPLYQDGVYSGEAYGLKGLISVEVAVKSDKITSITVLDYQDTPAYAEEAFDVMKTRILKKQSPQVDAQSGATYASTGYKNAVADALSKAKVKVQPARPSKSKP